MVHYTCDLCGQSLTAQRYTVQIEVAAAFDPDQITAADLDQDNLDAISSELDELESTADFELLETGPKTFHYDLCEVCCHKFSKAPLAPHRQPALNFSRN